MSKQLTAFLENRPGRVRRVAGILSRGGVNIKAFNLADTTSFGVLRMIVEDPESGHAVLKSAGIASQLTEVLAVEMTSEAGSLYALLSCLDDDNSIEYMYPYDTSADGPDRAGMILKLDDPEKGRRQLIAAGYTVY